MRPPGKQLFPRRNPLKEHERRMDALERRLRRMETSHTPTVPLYLDFPENDDSVQGQTVVGGENTLSFFTNDRWRHAIEHYAAVETAWISSSSYTTLHYGLDPASDWTAVPIRSAYLTAPVAPGIFQTDLNVFSNPVVDGIHVVNAPGRSQNVVALIYARIQWLDSITTTTRQFRVRQNTVLEIADDTSFTYPDEVAGPTEGAFMRQSRAMILYADGDVTDPLNLLQMQYKHDGTDPISAEAHLLVVHFGSY